MKLAKFSSSIILGGSVSVLIPMRVGMERRMSRMRGALWYAGNGVV
jgi:hypothetical protein